MMISLHKKARTTPEIRAQIAASTEPVSVLAARYGVTAPTIYKWRSRESVFDRSHATHRLQTTLSPEQEMIAVALRQTLLLSLDDLLSVMREFICAGVSRSGLNRCLQRHEVASLRTIKSRSQKGTTQSHQIKELGYFFFDVKCLPPMPDKPLGHYLFIAVDQATRWVYLRPYTQKNNTNLYDFIKKMYHLIPQKISHLTTQDGQEFTDILSILQHSSASSNNQFSLLCQSIGVTHQSPQHKFFQNNDTKENLKPNLTDVLETQHFLHTHFFESTLLHFAYLYNHQIPQVALQSRTPFQALSDYFDSHPQLFQKCPYNQPECEP